jgi:transposase InsO family protein
MRHTTRGVQYNSTDFIKELYYYGFEISMSRKGNPYDNAFAESMIKTLKPEQVHMWEYHTISDVQLRIPDFIDEVNKLQAASFSAWL